MSKATSLYLPKFPWFRELLREINKTESISSHLFNLANEDLYVRKLIKKDIYVKIREVLSTKVKPRTALLGNDFPVCKLYIKDDFIPLIEAMELNQINRTAYFWTLLIKNAKIRKDQMEEFKQAYPDVA